MIDSSNSIEGGCTDCNDPHSCGSYHVYVISLGDGTSYDFYVGQTGKTVSERLADNWAKYNSRGGGPRLIRNHFSGLRMDLVPVDSVACSSRSEAERKELALAEGLRRQGYKVRGPKGGS